METERKVKIQDICTHKSVENDSDFVGLRYNHDERKYYIDFPLGYNNPNLPKSNKEYTEQHEKELKNDILNLIYVLSHFSNTNNQTQKPNELSKYDGNNLPIYSYLYVIRYFFKHNYYKLRKDTLKRQTKGKINWNRTIKNIQPMVDNNNFIYLDFITNKQEVNDKELLTIINKYCVYESFNNIGYLLTSYMPPNPHIQLKKQLFLNTLKNQLQKTFNDTEKYLFKSMIDIIEFNSKEHSGNTFFYGTYNFNLVWQNLIDNYFGTRKTKGMYPYAEWVNAGQNTITFEPDTVMFPLNKETKEVYVLDAKYYKGSIDKRMGSLPRAESIPKQITYGKQLYKLYNYPEDKGYKIYNAFIMPKDCLKTINGKKSTIQYVAPIKLSWLLPEEQKKTLYHIQGIQMDMRSLMYNEMGNKDSVFEDLINIIKTGVETVILH